jgi:hypothetical protein
VIARSTVVPFCIALLSPFLAAAQTVSAAPAAVVEFAVGHAGFVDDATIHHAVIGGSARWPLSPHVSIGPEIVYMRGPDDDRNWLLTGNVTFDLRSPLPRPRVVPFFVAGAGLFQHHDRFGGRSFVSTEGAFTAGGGVRAAITDRWYVGGEARVGWELHTRLNAIVGVRLGK